MKRLTKFLMGPEDKIRQNSYIWNSLAGLLHAGQSVLYLMVITRACGIDAAGVFTIAYASANLFMYLGNYGMRSYQVTDVARRYQFSDYVGSRIVTCAAMIISGVLYVVYGFLCNDYSAYKAAVVLTVCVLKAIDAAEDVFAGHYQQQGRLDVGAKIMAVRLILAIVCLCGVVIVTGELLTACVITVVVCAVVSIAGNVAVIRYFETGPICFSAKRIAGLLRDCIGPFLAVFLAFYVGNAPKYAIDAHLSQDMQAYYGFISMPVFVVGLLNSFLYQPILISLAEDWDEKRFKRFIRRILKQILIIFALTATALAGAYLLGIPVLSLLYHADLGPYKKELLILLAGSGMLATSNFINVVLTIQRHQRDLIWGYLLIAVLAFVLSPVFVRSWAITGAAWVYTILISCLTLVFAVILTVRIRVDCKSEREHNTVNCQTKCSSERVPVPTDHGENGN